MTKEATKKALPVLEIKEAQQELEIAGFEVIETPEADCVSLAARATRRCSARSPLFREVIEFHATWSWVPGLLGCDPHQHRLVNRPGPARALVLAPH